MIKIFDNSQQLFQYAAVTFTEIANDSIESRGRFTVALAGGSTPKTLYQLLASEEFKNKIDWTSILFFFGDERNVSPSDNESNYNMALQNMLQPLNIAEENIYRWQTELNEPEKIAEDYERKIKSCFSDYPKFDLILLGMGDDGHTASLFPFTEALKEEEKIAVANSVEKLAATRLTLTFPLINNSRNVIFLIKGADKSEALLEVLEGEFQPEKFPSQNVKLPDGNLFWLVDSEAAQLLR